MALQKYSVWLLLIYAGIAIAFGVHTTVFANSPEPSLRITEIMYNAEGNDEGKEFVEVINTGPGTIDMTTVKFFEREDRETGRAITAHQGSAVLQPGDVAVIVAKPELFLEHYTYSGTVLDTSSFALLNAGAQVSLKKEDHLLHRITYAMENGANGDGESLHIKQNDTLAPGDPTPGEVSNIAIDTSTPDTTTESAAEGGTNSQQETTTQQTTTQQTSTRRTSSTRDTSPPPRSKKVTTHTLVANPPVVFVASTTEFSVVREEDGKKTVLEGLWNFGDGDHTRGAAVEHAYLHAGAYIIVFQELKDRSEGIVLQKEVRVLFPQVDIERVDDAFVRLHNRHASILDVSGWRIESPGTVFTFPPKSLVPKQNSIVVPFAAPADQDIFFVTAGGGQFRGKKAATVDTPAPENLTQEEETEETEEDESIAEASQEVETGESDAETEQNTADEETAAGSTEKQSADRQDSGVFVTDTYITQEEEESDMELQMIIVWIALLVGVITIALVPIIFARRERERRLHGHE